MGEDWILHHGKLSKIFKVENTDTDYFRIMCGKCGVESEIVAVLIDNAGRIIFNLYCPDCKAFDALKIGIKSLSRIYLSPRLAGRIGKHRWDDA